MAQEKRSASTRKAQIKRLYGCGPGTSEQPQEKSSGWDGQYAEKGGARHKKSGEQAAKYISALVHHRTCVVGEGGSSRNAKIPDNVLAASMDAFLIKQMTETAGKIV